MSDGKEIDEALAKSLNETTRDEEQHEIVQNWLTPSTMQLKNCLQFLLALHS